MKKISIAFAKKAKNTYPIIFVASDDGKLIDSFSSDVSNCNYKFCGIELPYNHFMRHIIDNYLQLAVMLSGKFWMHISFYVLSDETTIDYIPEIKYETPDNVFDILIKAIKHEMDMFELLDSNDIYLKRFSNWIISNNIEIDDVVELDFGELKHPMDNT